MRTIAAVCGKDVRSYFHSFAAYILITIFLLLTGFFFSASVSYYSFYSFQLASQPQQPIAGFNLMDAVITGLFFNFAIVILLIVPILTMRSFAEEQKQGTYELLMTYPVRERDIVFGKFLAVQFVFLVMIAPLLLQFALLRMVGGIFEARVVLTGFAGLWLMGSAFLAFGIFASSVSENQVISAIISFGFLLFLWMISWVTDFLPASTAAWINEISLFHHADDFFKGIIQLKHIAYYAFFAFFFLATASWRLESRKWVR